MDDIYLESRQFPFFKGLAARCALSTFAGLSVEWYLSRHEFGNCVPRTHVDQIVSWLAEERRAAMLKTLVSSAEIGCSSEQLRWSRHADDRNRLFKPIEENDRKETKKKKKKKNASRLASEGRRAEVSCPEGEIATLYSQLTSKSSDVSN